MALLHSNCMQGIIQKAKANKFPQLHLNQTLLDFKKHIFEENHLPNVFGKIKPRNEKENVFKMYKIDNECTEKIEPIIQGFRN